MHYLAKLQTRKLKNVSTSVHKTESYLSMFIKHVYDDPLQVHPTDSLVVPNKDGSRNNKISQNC